MNQEMLKRILPEDAILDPINEAAHVLGLLGEAYACIQDCINHDEDSVFFEDEDLTNKLIKHIVKAGDVMLKIEEPLFRTTLDITLSKLEEIDNG